MTTRDDATTAAGQVIADGIAWRDNLPPRQAAEACWTPTGPSVDELEARIRRMRGETEPVINVGIGEAA